MEFSGAFGSCEERQLDSIADSLPSTRLCDTVKLGSNLALQLIDDSGLRWVSIEATFGAHEPQPIGPWGRVLIGYNSTTPARLALHQNIHLQQHNTSAPSFLPNSARFCHTQQQ
jgi:hypothetical protein